MLAQALDGLVRPRTDPGRHYALQESELVCLPAGSSPATDTILDAVAAVRLKKEGEGADGVGGGGGAEKALTSAPLRLLYHHNDEVWGFFLPLPAVFETFFRCV